MAKDKIHIKKSHEGKFTEYCGGKVTDEKIQQAKKSSNPKLRKMAVFAENARKWKHENGGRAIPIAAAGLWLKDMVGAVQHGYNEADKWAKENTGNSLAQTATVAGKTIGTSIQESKVRTLGNQKTAAKDAADSKLKEAQEKYNIYQGLQQQQDTAIQNAQAGMQNKFDSQFTQQMGPVNMDIHLAGSGIDNAQKALGQARAYYDQYTQLEDSQKTALKNLQVSEQQNAQQLSTFGEDVKNAQLVKPYRKEWNKNGVPAMQAELNKPIVRPISQTIDPAILNPTLNIPMQKNGGVIHKYANGNVVENPYKSLFSTYESVAGSYNTPMILPDGTQAPNYLGLALSSDRDHTPSSSQKLTLSDRFSTQDQRSSDNVVSKGSKKDIVNFFTGKGLTVQQASGIYGNLMVESNLNTEAMGDKGTSRGIAQWHSQRKTNLENYEKKHGSSLNTQLEFLWEELNSTEKKALEDLKKQTTIEGATKSFMVNFERPNIKYANLNARIKYALS